MTAEVDVANFALGRLGIGQSIESLSEQTKLARECKRWFNLCRDMVLRDFPWSFANRAEALALVSGETYPGYEYLYAYPQDCLALRNVADENGMRYSAAAFNWPQCWDAVPVIARFPYKLALKADGASQVIACDLPDAWGYFTARVTNLNVWPSDAISTFAWCLAAEAGGALQANAQMVGRATQMYEGLRNRAAANSMNEARDDIEPEASSIRARAF
jgi:hypothetical protein